MENSISLKEFLDESGESMARKVTEELTVVHDPATEKEEGIEGVIGSMAKKPFPSQGEIVKACYKSLMSGNRAVYMVAEMGTGKTLMAIAVAELLNRLKGTRALVVCPPHLVPKWIEAPCCNLQGSFDLTRILLFWIRSLAPQQYAGMRSLIRFRKSRTASPAQRHTT